MGENKTLFDFELTPDNYECACQVAKILKCSVRKLVSFCLRGVINPERKDLFYP